MKNAVATVAAVALLVAVPPLVAQNAADHWVGTWSTSEVGRLQAPQPPAPALPPFMPNQCPVVAPAVPPVAPAPGQVFRAAAVHALHESDAAPDRPHEHRRRKARVVLSNRYGTAPLTVGAAQVALREADRRSAGGSGRPLTFSGKPTSPFRPEPSPTAIRSTWLFLKWPIRGRSLPARHHEHHRALDHAHRGVSDQLRVGDRQPCGSREPAGGGDDAELVRPQPPRSPDAGRSVAGLVTYGDSITDGTRSTPDTNSRWPDQLVRRHALAAEPARESAS